MNWLFIFCFIYPILGLMGEDVGRKNCPVSCTCGANMFHDLVLSRWYLETATGNETLHTQEKQKHEGNDVIYEEDKYINLTLRNNISHLLQMAMCIFQQESDPEYILSALPTNIQVLSILQARDSGKIDIHPHHIQQFQDLNILEIYGYNAEGSESTKKNDSNKKQSINSIVIHNDVLKVLPNLEYINFQHIKLLGEIEIKNKISLDYPPFTDKDILTNELSHLPGNKVINFKRGRSKMHRLPPITIQKADPDNDILPYNEYLQKQEYAGLSIFAGLSNLKFLRIYGCDLQRITWEMFEGLDRLEYLSLENNNLLFIPDFAFYGTPNLKTLSLAHNQLLNLDSTSLAGLLELEKLDLSHNNISHFSELSLPPFPKLKTANFKQNPTEIVFASTFEVMNATLTLSLGGEGSPLDIQPNSFSGLQALQKLNLYNVRVSQLDREMLTGMTKLRDLHIKGKITTISYDAFLDVNKLEKLTLKECQIESVSMDTFYGLYGLLFLDLSNNLLESLPPGLFEQQFSLRELYLNNNKLKSLPPGVFSTIPAKVVRLDGNPWHCTCEMKDWPSGIINKVKVKTNVFCQYQYDKGNMCEEKLSHIYVQEKRVSPKCASPKKYEEWNVFNVLRKELECYKKLPTKLTRKMFLKIKQMDYEKNIKNNELSVKKKDEMGQNVTSYVNRKIESQDNSSMNYLNHSQANDIKFLQDEIPANHISINTSSIFTSMPPDQNAETPLAQNKTSTNKINTTAKFKAITVTVLSTPNTNLLNESLDSTVIGETRSFIINENDKIEKYTSNREDNSLLINSYDTVNTFNHEENSKKKKQKEELLKERLEKQTIKESFIYNNNNIYMATKNLKKSLKLEREKKQQEKFQPFKQ